MNKFNKLTIIKELPRERKPCGQIYRIVFCKCDCGTLKKIRYSDLVNGNTKSCGCISRKKSSERMKTHGLSKTKLYNIWNGMKARCENKNVKQYVYYGGRGIKLHKSWKKFENFLNDMGQTYKNGLSIERVDVNGDYCKENCKWIPRNEQTRNRRNTHILVFNGVALSLNDWSKKLNIKYSTLQMRINQYHWPLDRAFSN